MDGEHAGAGGRLQHMIAGMHRVRCARDEGKAGRRRELLQSHGGFRAAGVRRHPSRDAHEQTARAWRRAAATGLDPTTPGTDSGWGRVVLWKGLVAPVKIYLSG